MARPESIAEDWVVGQDPPVSASRIELARLIGLTGGFLILIDSAISYPWRLLVDDKPWQTSLVALPAVALFLLSPLRTGLLSARYLGWMGLLTIGCILGYLNGGEVDQDYLIQMPLALAVFMLGYLVRETSIDGQDVTRIFVAAAAVHFGLSLLIFAGLLPMLDSHDFMMFGQLYARKFYYADSNYQTFYWTIIPCLLLLRSPLGFFVGLIANGLLALFYLDIQTRSGFVVFGGQIVLALILRARRAGQSFGFVLGMMACLLAVPALLTVPAVRDPFMSRLTTLGTRFQDNDSVQNIWQRLESQTYLLEKLPTRASLVPIGHREFIARTGQVAHAAPTSVFLLTGLVGLIAWAALTVMPAVRLAGAALGGRLAHEDNMDALAFLGMLAIAVTLPTPFQKPFWLAAGLICARLDRLAAGEVPAPAAAKPVGAP